MSDVVVRVGDARDAFEAACAAHGRGYVPQMRSDALRIMDPARNPFVAEGHGSMEILVAYRDGRPVGRVVASVHDDSNRAHGERRGRFGFLDYVDDFEVARALMDGVERWAAGKGMAEVAGNFSLTAMQQVGVVTSGFEGEPYTDMTWTPPHVAAHLGRLGYEPFFPMTTFETELSAVDAGALLGPAQRAILDDPGYEAVTVTRRGLSRSLEEAREVLNDGFADNPMFVPPTEAEFGFQAGEMTWIMDPRLSQLVRHRGRPVGVLICIPDLAPLMRATGGRIGASFPWHFLRHRARRRRAVIIYYSVARAHHGKGINGLMLARAVGALRSAGYERLGTTWIADANAASRRQMERLGARPLHRLHLFRKALTR